MPSKIRSVYAPPHQRGVQACRDGECRPWNHGNCLRRFAQALRFQQRLRHFLNEQRNAISPLDDVLPDVRRAGQRSLARSALVEAVEQFRRALAQIATLPTTPALRREEIKLQVAVIAPLFHVKGYSAPETKATPSQRDVQNR
jgi:hypothetical protein